MIRKRERLEIILDILLVIRDRRGHVKPTHILYKSNLSSKMLKEYLQELLALELITREQSGGRTSYSLTEKGFDYIRDFTIIKNFMRSYGLDER